MQSTRITSKPVHEVIAAIDALDLTPIKARLIDPQIGQGWTQEYADAVEQAYKTYLRMVAKYQDHAEDIMLTKDTDEFWHTHILDTRKYAADCERVFGTFLHHAPQARTGSVDEARRRAERADLTRSLHAQEARNAAFCGAAVHTTTAGFCGAAVTAAQPAFCGAAMRADQAAFCGAAVKAEHAAFCGAAVKAEHAAFCGAAVNAERAAFCGAAVKAEQPAFCGAAVKRDQASFCGAAREAAGEAFATTGA